MEMKMDRWMGRMGYIEMKYLGTFKKERDTDEVCSANSLAIISFALP